MLTTFQKALEMDQKYTFLFFGEEVINHSGNLITKASLGQHLKYFALSVSWFPSVLFLCFSPVQKKTKFRKFLYIFPRDFHFLFLFFDVFTSDQEITHGLRAAWPQI